MGGITGGTRGGGGGGVKIKTFTNFWIPIAQFIWIEVSLKNAYEFKASAPKSCHRRLVKVFLVSVPLA